MESHDSFRWRTQKHFPTNCCIVAAENVHANHAVWIARIAVTLYELHFLQLATIKQTILMISVQTQIKDTKLDIWKIQSSVAQLFQTRFYEFF